MKRFCGLLVGLVCLGISGACFAQERPDFIPTGMVHTGKKSKSASSEKVLYSFDIGKPDMFTINNEDQQNSFNKLGVEKKKAIASTVEQLQGKPAQVKKARSWAEVEQEFRTGKEDLRKKGQEIENDFTTMKQDLKNKKQDCVKNNFYRC